MFLAPTWSKRRNIKVLKKDRKDIGIYQRVKIIMAIDCNSRKTTFARCDNKRARKIPGGT